MEEMIMNFPNQLEEALKIASEIKIKVSRDSIDNVIICGMGGSAIGGSFIQSFFRLESAVPIFVNRSYDIPAWVNDRTLVIVSSYSGNTEETVAACHTAISAQAKMVILTSGGKLREMAINHKIDLVTIPPGSPSPRACLGYSIVLMTKVLIEAKVVNDLAFDSLRSAMQLIKYDQDSIMQEAMSIAKILHSKTPVIYCPDHLETSAIRWRQQINENSKLLCWHHVIPEMTHNEIVGWLDQRDDIAVIVFRSRDSHKRVVHRIDFLIEALTELSSHVYEVNAKGNSIIESSIYLIHLGDWVSLYLAQFKGVDPIEITIIDKLKREMGSI